MRPRRESRRGWGEEELRQFEDMLPIPKAMHWSQEASSFLVDRGGQKTTPAITARTSRR